LLLFKQFLVHARDHALQGGPTAARRFTPDGFLRPALLTSPD
jgi:hypothetical protein